MKPFTVTCAAVIVAASTVLAPALHAGPSDVKVALHDPFDTGIWSYHQKKILGDPDRIRFDERVVVQAPASAEDSLAVPLLIDATAIEDVERIVVFVDYGPIPRMLTFYPGGMAPKFAFRFKIDQSTPVRAAVRTKDGSWHVGHTHVSAAGGGCTAPALAYASDDWEEKLGEVAGSVWPDAGRMKIVIDHPMDTGLAGSIPRFIIETVGVSAADGRKLARIELDEPVSEDPAFTFFFRDGERHKTVRVNGRDNNGNTFDAEIGPQLTQ